MIDVAAHLAVWPVLAAVPNPPAIPVPGLQNDLNTIIGWMKYLSFFLGFIGLIWCGMQMMVGRRQRHAYAADGAAGIPWVIAGLTLVAIAAGVVGVFLQP